MAQAHGHQSWLEGIARRYRVGTLVVERIGGVHDDAFVAQLQNRLRPQASQCNPFASRAAKKIGRGWRWQRWNVDCFSLAATAEIRGQVGSDFLGQAIRNVNSRGGSHWIEDYFAEVDRLRCAAALGGGSPSLLRAGRSPMEGRQSVAKSVRRHVALSSRP